MKRVVQFLNKYKPLKYLTGREGYKCLFQEQKLKKMAERWLDERGGGSKILSLNINTELQ